jgi:hypothetical protein
MGTPLLLDLSVSEPLGVNTECSAQNKSEFFLENFKGTSAKQRDLLMFLYEQGYMDSIDGEEIMRAILEAEAL